MLEFRQRRVELKFNMSSCLCGSSLCSDKRITCLSELKMMETRRFTAEHLWTWMIHFLITCQGQSCNSSHWEMWSFNLWLWFILQTKLWCPCRLGSCVATLSFSSDIRCPMLWFQSQDALCPFITREDVPISRPTMWLQLNVTSLILVSERLECDAVWGLESGKRDQGSAAVANFKESQS